MLKRADTTDSPTIVTVPVASVCSVAMKKWKVITAVVHEIYGKNKTMPKHKIHISQMSIESKERNVVAKTLKPTLTSSSSRVIGMATFPSTDAA